MNWLASTCAMLGLLSSGCALLVAHPGDPSPQQCDDSYVLPVLGVAGGIGALVLAGDARDEATGGVGDPTPILVPAMILGGLSFFLAAGVKASAVSECSDRKRAWRTRPRPRVIHGPPGSASSSL